MELRWVLFLDVKTTAHPSPVANATTALLQSPGPVFYVFAGFSCRSNAAIQSAVFAGALLALEKYCEADQSQILNHSGFLKVRAFPRFIPNFSRLFFAS